LYAIVGYPCGHSRSPAMYNRLFAHYGLGSFYTRIEWPSIGDVMREARRLAFRGLSITIPFKVDAVPCMDEVDEHATAIGAVNTAVMCGDRMYGYNTDWIGVRRPLEHLRGSRAVLLGAGGAAAAAAYALLALDMDLTILNRTPQKAEELAARFGCQSGSLEDIGRIPADVVVNATPVGMEPDTRSILRGDELPEGCTVFDLVYTPPETPLLREAKKAGCTTIPGTEMFVYQACEQFRLFTGIEVPEELVREAIKG
ncbi:MAG TPA: shikimate dehydrogenase, partial [Methanomicrobiales archaeon]|nr:shikimate dehydrogenase [Methanomicrobiales archaeon]